MEPEYLSSELQKTLDEAAKLIRGSSDLEQTLYAALDYLEDGFLREAGLLSGERNSGRKLVSKLLLFATNDGPKIVGNIEKKASLGSTIGSEVPFEDWTAEEQEAFPKTNGDLDSTWMMVKISEGSTRYCYYTPDGRKKCYTR